MKSFVVLTYYHFLHATAMALSMEEKPNLYFSVNYLDVPETLLQKIRDTEIFNSVVPLDINNFKSNFFSELKNTKGMTQEEIRKIGLDIFEKHLEPYYEEQFKGADKEDEIYIYNDNQYHYYYIARHFKKIIGVEDGYRALEQQINLLEFKGVAANLYPFIEAGLFPKTRFKEDKIKTIISSCTVENIDEYYKDKIKVIDFYNLIEENRDTFSKNIRYIFDIDIDTIKGDNILIGQPLDRAKYCDAIDYYLLNKKIIRENTGTKLFIKPHPAEHLDFSLFNGENISIIDKAFPIELLNYCDVSFEKGISFDSTSLNTMKCIKQLVRVYESEKRDKGSIKKSIQNNIKEERLDVCVIVKIDSVSLENYVNVHTYISNNKKIRYHVILVIDPNVEDSAESFYDSKNYEKNINNYLCNSIEQSAAWSSEIKKAYSSKERYPENTSIHIIREKNCDKRLFELALDIVPNADYYFCTESANLGIMITDVFNRALKKAVRHAMVFPSMAIRGNVKVPLTLTDMRNMTCTTSNTIIHRSILERAIVGDNFEFELTREISAHTHNVSTGHTMHLFLKSKIFDESIDEKWFHQKIILAIEYSEKIDDEQIRKEFVLRMLTSVVDEYITWCGINNKLEVYEKMNSFMENIDIDTALKIEILQHMVNAFYMDRVYEYNRFIYQEAMNLTYYNATEKWLFQTDKMKSLDEKRKKMEEKLKNKKKNKVKKKIRGFLKK